MEWYYPSIVPERKGVSCIALDRDRRRCLTGRPGEGRAGRARRLK